jgi:hypothetical protein
MEAVENKGCSTRRMRGGHGQDGVKDIAREVMAMEIVAEVMVIPAVDLITKVAATTEAAKVIPITNLIMEVAVIMAAQAMDMEAAAAITVAAMKTSPMMAFLLAWFAGTLMMKVIATL